MKCPRCQHENPSGSKFCLHCGVGLGAERPEPLSQAAPGEAWSKVMAYLCQAGASASARPAHQEAIAFFEHALGALKYLPESRDTLEQAIDLRFDLRSALWPLGEIGRILESLREAESLAAALDDERRLGQVFAYMSTNYWLVGDHERALEFGRRAMVIAEGLKDAALEFDTNLRLSFVYHSVGDYSRAIEATRRNVDALEADLLRERFGGQPTLLSVLSRAWLVLSLVERGEFADGIAEEGIQIAEAVVHPLSLIFAFYGVGVLYLGKGEFGKAIPALERALALVEGANVALWFPVIASPLGSAYALAGRVAEALPLVEQPLERLAAMSLVANKALFTAHLSEAYLLAGRLKDAVAFAEQAREIAHTLKERGHEAWALRLLGEIASHPDSPDAQAAERHYREALGLADDLGMRPLVAHCHLGLGRLYRRTGKRQEVQEHLSPATTMYREMDMRFWLEQAERELKELE